MPVLTYQKKQYVLDVVGAQFHWGDHRVTNLPCSNYYLPNTADLHVGSFRRRRSAAAAVAAVAQPAAMSSAGEQEAPAAVPQAKPLPVLCKTMPRSELAEYLTKYETESGTKLFAQADLDALEHISVEGLYDHASSQEKWRAVTDALFSGDRSTSQVLLFQVRTAKLSESKAERQRQTAEAKREAKAQLMQKRREADEPSRQTDQESADTTNKRPRINGLAAILASSKLPLGTTTSKAASCTATRIVEVPFPKKGFDTSGSETYKYFRDDPNVLESMLGWTLTTSTLSLPKSIGKQAQPEGAERAKLTPKDPIFKFHGKWVFSLSAVALQNLIEDTGGAGKAKVRSLEGKLDARHFLKAASAANRANKAATKAAAKAAPQAKKPRSLVALQNLQTEQREQLEREFELLLGPLEERVLMFQTEFTASMVEHGLNSQATKDAAAQLEAAAKEVQEMKSKKKVGVAEQRAQHLAQMGAMKAPTPMQVALKAQQRAAAAPTAMPAAATTATAATATTTPDAPEEENAQYRQGILARAAAEEGASSTLASTTATTAAVTAVAAAAPSAAAATPAAQVAAPVMPATPNPLANPLAEFDL